MTFIGIDQPSLISNFNHWFKSEVLNDNDTLQPILQKGGKYTLPNSSTIGDKNCKIDIKIGIY